jgi:hypothetical protein
MLIYLLSVACLLPVLSLGQTVSTVEFPKLLATEPVPNNDSLLNFTFTFPVNPKYAKLTANYTLYEFSDPDKTKPTISRSQPAECGNSTNYTCLTSSVPPVAFHPGTYVIGCFQWNLTDRENVSLIGVNDCILGQTTLNFTKLPALDLIVGTPNTVNATTTIATYFPAVLPYDRVKVTPSSLGSRQSVPSNVTSSLIRNLQAVSSNVTSNDTYSSIYTFSYNNLPADAAYNICFTVSYENSIIPGSKKTKVQCQVPLATLPTISAPPSSSVKIMSDFMLLISMFMFVRF